MKKPLTALRHWEGEEKTVDSSQGRDWGERTVDSSEGRDWGKELLTALTEGTGGKNC